MTCVAKEYEIKTKMRFLLVYNLKTFGGEGIKIWWLDFSRWGGGDEKIYGWWRDSQGFPNSSKGCGGGIQKFCWGEFCTGWWEPVEE